MKKNKRTKLASFNLSNRKGFTLIELIIVLAIMGIVINLAFSMNIFGIRTYAKGSDRYDLNTETNLLSEYITRNIRYAYGVEILTALDTIPSSSDIASSEDPMDAYIYVSNVLDKAFVNYRDKAGTKTLGEFDSCSLLFTPVQLNKSLNFIITTSIKNENFSVDSGIVPTNLLIQKSNQIIDNTGTEDGVALKISNGNTAVMPEDTLTLNTVNLDGKVEVDFNKTLSVTGGSPPYNYTVSHISKLPYGLTLSSSGTISGKPIEAGTFTVVVVITDSSTPSISASRYFNITIANKDGVVPIPEAPITSNVIITGPPSIINDNSAVVGSILTVTYDYYNQEDQTDLGIGSTFKWWRGSTDDGIGLSEISGATGKTYTSLSADVGKYIYVSVTPKNTENLQGITVFSNFPVKIMPSGENSKPVANDVAITKDGNKLVGSYKYYDAEDDKESSPIYRWYVASNPDGSDKTLINGKTTNNINRTDNAYKDKYIFFEVSPRASTGSHEGDAVMSANYKI